MTQVDQDAWAWVEPEPGLDKPIVGWATGRTQFPPAPEHPAVQFSRYDPIAPRRPPLVEVVPGGDVSSAFKDYNLFGGWNADKSLALIGLSYDTTSGGGTGAQTPRFAKIVTTDPDLSTWVVEPDVYLIPDNLVISTHPRFIPITDHGCFLASDSDDSFTKLFRLDTDTMTVSVLYVDLFNYAYSFDATRIAMDLPGQGVRVFNRDLTGAPTTELSVANIFDFSPRNFEFTDDGRYIVAWDSEHWVAHSAYPPFAKDYETFQSVELAGLFGPVVASIGDMWIHPTYDYVGMSIAVSLGLGGSNTQTLIVDRDGIIVATTTGGYNGLIGPDWSQSGDIWIGSDGGRDPYGGVEVIMKTGSWVSSVTSPQEQAHYRVRPYH